MLRKLSDLVPEPYDVVALGAGGAGLSAALVAAVEGARVLIVERTQYVGGTTALSGGTTWVPGTRHAASVGSADTLAEAAAYLDRAVGARASPALRRKLLDTGPQAVDYIEAHSEVKYRAYPLHPDYLSEIEGSTVKGRALEPLPFDGRKLGTLFSLLRPPIPEFTVLGGMMVDRADIFHLLRMTKSLASLRHAARILGRHAKDRLRHRRGTRLVMGNALVGRLLYSLMQRRNVSLVVETEIEAIERDATGIRAVTLAQGGARRTIGVTGGVILATGGFNRHPALRTSMLPGVDAGWCPGAPGHTGRAHDLARSLGARYGTNALSHAFWAPVSVRRRPDGSNAVFPHFLMDRGKPGTVVVNARGRRFVNETTSYHLFGIAMQERGVVPAYLVGDADALQKYGMGMVRPGAKGLEPFLADGYLTAGDTLEALGTKLGIDGKSLAETVARFNAYAKSGVDPEFGRGATAYQRNLGDASWSGPNPCLGALAKAPFYAVRLYPGDIGAATGFATDANARVLAADGTPIAGLYAAGNDMHSAMGGVYAGPGITIGPGLVFGYVAARDAAARATARRDQSAPLATEEVS